VDVRMQWGLSVRVSGRRRVRSQMPRADKKRGSGPWAHSVGYDILASLEHFAVRVVLLLAALARLAKAELGL
jgi:hypothetical protein